MDEEQNLDGVDNDAVLVPSSEVVKYVLHLLAVRSAVRVGIMLNENFPDEETLMNFLNSEETLEGLQAFADAKDDIAQLAVQDAELDPERLAKAIEAHQPRAVEAVDLLAERIGINPADLFSFLLRV
jgi:hypothetical protein